VKHDCFDEPDLYADRDSLQEVFQVGWNRAGQCVGYQIAGQKRSRVPYAKLETRFKFSPNGSDGFIDIFLRAPMNGIEDTWTERTWRFRTILCLYWALKPWDGKRVPGELRVG
jgi:hypothetical protein